MRLNKERITAAAAALYLFGFAAWNLVSPNQAESTAERRSLAQFPEATVQTILSGRFMSEFDTFSLDQFPLRDPFRTLKALTAGIVMGETDNNGIYLADGYVSKLDAALQEDSLRYAAGRFRFLYERYLADTDCRIYLSIIPDKNYFMAKQNGYPDLDYDRLISVMREEMPYAVYADLFPALSLEDYYRTDTHWRQERLGRAAVVLAETMGSGLTQEYTEKELDVPFYGVYYGQSALPLKPDSIKYLDSGLFDACTVYDYETGTEGTIYHPELARGRDPYEFFLAGSKSLLTIRNPQAKTDRELVIFRDSFGSSVAPLLAEAYRSVTLVDIRYLQPALLGRFLTFENQDILFLYSTSVLNNSVTLK